MTMHELAAGLSQEVCRELAATGYGSLSQTRCFALVRMSRGAATAARLSRWQRMTRQSATVVINDLVARGYAQRQPDAENRRQLMLRLTSKGENTLGAAERIAASAIATRSASLTPAETQESFETLHRMLNAHLWIIGNR